MIAGSNVSFWIRFLRVPRHFLGIEPAKSTAIPSAFFEHDRPTESGLRRFEHQKLEVFSVIVDWHTPFAIVILEHKGIVHADPGTSFRGHKVSRITTLG
jgi:hypothetical protein